MFIYNVISNFPALNYNTGFKKDLIVTISQFCEELQDFQKATMCGSRCRQHIGDVISFLIREEEKYCLFLSPQTAGGLFI